MKDIPERNVARSFKGEIEFEHVSFGYGPDAPVLKDVSFRIEPGQVVALVGPSGAGKTSIISLIPRFYDPLPERSKSMASTFAGLSKSRCASRSSFVLQETLLFHGPVWKNIAYGKPGCNSRRDLRAAELANAHEFIDKLPDGYNTIVGERG